MTAIESLDRGNAPTHAEFCHALREVVPPAAAAEHARKIERIKGWLRNRRTNKPVSLRKRHVSHQVPKFVDLKKADERLDVADLDQILVIDPVQRICVAEPGVAFDTLVEATMKYGLVPCVVPELKTITVGGAVSGCSIESTSFRLGGFHDTCLAYEVVTGLGEVLTCTPGNENHLLFQMMHCSFGTLGLLSQLTFRLMPAKRYVRLQYEKYTTLAEYKAAIVRHFEASEVEFMDGLIHGPNELVLCVGNFVDKAPYVNRYDWMKVYYTSTRERTSDYLRTPDYFFRYDRGVTNVHPKSWLGRLFLGKLMSSERLLRIAEKARWLLPKRPPVTLDVFLPFSKLDAFMEWHDRTFGHYALWCVPYKRVRDYEWLSPNFYAPLRDELFVDIAIYGMPQPDGQNAYRMIEEKLFELGGMKTLISHNYYSEEEFWRTWNRGNYDRAKKRADPTNIFRDLYAKTCSPHSRASP